MKPFYLLLLFAVFAAANTDEEELPPPEEEQLDPKDLPELNNFATKNCHPKDVDVMFVIDQSGSIGSRNFATIRTFLENFAKQLTFPGAQMGLVEFNTYARKVFDLNTYHTAASLSAAIARMPYYGGGTNIAAGINFATNYEFKSTKGDRSNIDDVMVVMTDGRDSSNVAKAHQLAAAKNIKIIVIAVGRSTSQSELMKIVGGDASLIFHVSTFNNLTAIIQTLCNDVATACDASPCLNGATCTETNNGQNYICTCPNGFVGDQCQTAADPCQSLPCEHGGTCSANGASFSCHCSPDYSGPTCGAYLNPCASAACSNGSVCERINGTAYNCICPPGVTGQHCDSEICQHGGKFSCSCPHGFTGKYCEQIIDFCNSTEYLFNGSYVNVNICGLHGVCTNTGNGPICTCKPGWHGTYCQQDDDNCSPNPCLNNGTCIDIAGPGYACQCDKLHTGKNCSNDIDLCNRDVIDSATGLVVTVPICGEHGSCEQNGNGSICHCDEGWGGDFCDTEIPSACVYKNNVTHPHNSTWSDHCNTCTCQFGVVQCVQSHWCPKKCAIYKTNATVAAGVGVGCPEYQNCVPEDVNCAHESPLCSNPVGWCFPVGYVIVDPHLPANFHPPKKY